MITLDTMNFLKKLFGGKTEEVAENTMSAEAQHHMEEAEEMAEEAMHDAAAHTPAEETVEEVIEHHHESEHGVEKKPMV